MHETAPIPVEVPAGFPKKFQDLRESTLYAWVMVRKVNRYSLNDRGVLVITDRHLFLFDTEGHIKRLARLSDIEKAARSPESKTICIKFFKELNEPTLMLQLRSDPRNPKAQGDVLNVVDYFRKMARNGEELPVIMMNHEVERLMEFAPWEKPPGYAPPDQKLKLKTRYIWGGSVRPARA
eukprot:TRINITY_DN2331_c0_g1_i1.p1 TRINITY_DN2331_c0_g1~~TRINITY_DN2331_c0_g1_i1.p1  ORF type:complete len:194 (+),score=71.42 TRINITY_DN2331_c0_g1_i1:44-583(+)